MTESEYLFHERIAICIESGVSPERAEQIVTDEAQRREGERA